MHVMYGVCTNSCLCMIYMILFVHFFFKETDLHDLNLVLVLFVRHGYSMGFKRGFVFLLCLQEDLFWSGVL